VLRTQTGADFPVGRTSKNEKTQRVYYDKTWPGNRLISIVAIGEHLNSERRAVNTLRARASRAPNQKALPGHLTHEFAVTSLEVARSAGLWRANPVRTCAQNW